MDEANRWVGAKLLGPSDTTIGNPPPFSFVYGGKPSSELLKTWTVKRTSHKIDDQRTQLTATYSDPVTGLEIRCDAVQYGDFPTVEWTLHFKNNGQTDTPILEKIQALDAQFPRKSACNLLRYWEGGYANPEAFAPHESLPNRGFNPGTGRGSDTILPYFNLEYANGGVLIAVGWPGQWTIEFSDEKVTSGQQLTHLVLHPGEEIRTPLIALQFWKGGDWVDAQNVWRRWMIVHNMPTKDGKPLPPLLNACSSSQLGEMINANEENQFLFIDRYLAEGIKLDYWWMDAGWYPNNGSWQNIGTWDVDTKRFPHGLRAITDHGRASGVKSILWFEPERVTPGTWIWDNHPEWMLGQNPVNRLLNLGNPKALKWITDHVDHLITEQGIDLYRQDFNIAPLGYWRDTDKPDRQGITENHYVEGYLAYWDALRSRHPGMLIDSCASGGRRNDLETMRRSVPLLRSDYIFEPVGQQGHTYGFSSWVPYQGTGLQPTDAYAFRSAMTWSNTGVYDVRKKDLDYDGLRRLLGQRQEIAPYFLGDYYPLTPYSLSESSWIAWQFDRPETSGGVVQAFRRLQCADDFKRLMLRGLKPESRYRVTDIDTDKSQEMTGKQLMEDGILITLSKKPAAAVVFYQLIK